VDRVSHYERLQIGSMLHPPGVKVYSGMAVFLCPENESSEQLYVQAVGPALRVNGLNRVDVVRVFDSDSALVDVTHWLAEAEVIIAELSAPNPHLMYVLGLAHGLGRCPLMLVERTNQLPFNLAALRHVEYARGHAGLLALRSDLTRAIRVFLAAASASGDGS
jgi:hypothetical protein